MKRWSKRKIAVVAIAATMLMGGAAGAAWALLASGSATFTETTGTAGTVTVVPLASNMNDLLTPGGTAASMTLNVPNPSGTNPIEFMTAPAVTVTSTSGGAACPASNFTIVQPVWGDSSTTTAVTSYPYTLAAGATLKGDGGGGSTKGTIQMIASAPSGCENVTVNLALTVTG